MNPSQANSDSEPIADTRSAATVRAIDYETPPVRKQRSWPFWVVFWLLYLPGLLVLNIVDDALHRHLTGHANDGGIMVLSVFCSPLIAGFTGVVKQLFPRYRTLSFAAASAVLAPLLLYLTWVSIDLLAGR